MNLQKQSACWIIGASAFLCAVPLKAQQEEEQKPKPAARVLLPLPDLSGDRQNDNQDQDQGSQNLQPDNGPLTGIQAPTLGSSMMRHSYWVPGIQYSNTIRSSSMNPSATSGWVSTHYVTGNLSLFQNWRSSLLTLNYSGGGYFSNDSTQGNGQNNGQFQQLALGYNIESRRWQLLFIEQFAYLPESPF